MYSSSSSPTRALKDKQDCKYHLYLLFSRIEVAAIIDLIIMTFRVSMICETTIILIKITCTYVYSGHHDPHNHHYPDQNNLLLCV